MPGAWFRHERANDSVCNYAVTHQVGQRARAKPVPLACVPIQG